MSDESPEQREEELLALTQRRRFFFRSCILFAITRYMEHQTATSADLGGIPIRLYKLTLRDQPRGARLFYQVKVDGIRPYRGLNDTFFLIFFRRLIKYLTDLIQ